MPKKRSGGGLTRTEQAAKFLGVSVLSGVVLAGLAMPAAGALGLAAKGTVEEFDEIPADLKRPPLSQRTTILDAEGGLIATVYSRDRTVVPLEQISPHLQKAIVAIEDSRFYEHGAIDVKGVLRALNKNAQSGAVSEGASTLTQQYVKNVFVEEAGDDRDKFHQATQQTIGRKIQELKYAIQLEKELGKKKILENYLNITFFGQQAYGVESASQRYFSKKAKDLTLPEAAMIAGLVQSPSYYSPIRNIEKATDRRNIVLQRMVEVGDISQAEADQAKAEPIKLKITQPKNGCITARDGAGFFCDYVRNVFHSDPVFGKTREERAKIWNRGGLTIRTTLDPQAQKSAQKSLKKHVYQTDKVAGAVTMVEPGTGKILAMGQSKPYGFGKNETQINYSVDRKMGGSNFGFPTGSTFKPFLAAAALEDGKPATQVYASPYKMPYPDRVQTCSGNPWVNVGKDTAQNENTSEVGPYDLKKAMALSVNTYFVQMLEDTGMCPVVKTLDKLHVTMGDGKKLPESPSAMTLGSQGVSPLVMANAYATFANRGTYCSPVAIESIKTADGESMKVPKSKCSRAMAQQTADTVNTLLRGVTESGTGRQAGLQSRDSAGKTGTTDSRKNAWFVGYTPNLSGAVWVGSATQQVEMENITIGGTYHYKVFGGAVPGPIWRDAVSGALEGKPAPPFTRVHIPEYQKPQQPDRRPGRGDNKPGNGSGTGGNSTTTGGADTGGLVAGTGDGGDSPFPDIPIPPDLITGGTTTTGGDTGGNGNGGPGGGWNR
ncbi:penicillin-binding protein [Streptomyces sp. MUM 203J]|uniref:transglycosylase domain-containing protein n=1 Tax=Streptomyces sp. MUM 203J TaxID=2791990 RepID=UPI001F0365E6|nr:transglycosylase domain-containing protein [Streptomyces sp. MUM 203J]MCH0539766.1 penicillin-binding protein [Streptomyces sp. MUM 203J]